MKGLDLKNLTGKIKEVKRDDFLFAGLVVLAVLFAALLLWDGYLFYKTVWRKERPFIQPAEPISISVSDIDEVIKILDERRRLSEEILE